jgi:hypothetical protein
MANLVTNSLLVYGTLSSLNQFVASVIDAERNLIAFDTLIPMPDLKMTDDGKATDHLVGGLFYGASINTRLQWTMTNALNIRDKKPLEPFPNTDETTLAAVIKDGLTNEEYKLLTEFDDQFFVRLSASCLSLRNQIKDARYRYIESTSEKFNAVQAKLISALDEAEIIRDNVLAHQYPDWYSWRQINWGCDRPPNVESYEIDEYRLARALPGGDVEWFSPKGMTHQLTIVFYTRWSAPINGIAHLFDKYKLNMELESYDEYSSFMVTVHFNDDKIDIENVSFSRMAEVFD